MRTITTRQIGQYLMLGLCAALFSASGLASPGDYLEWPDDWELRESEDNDEEGAPEKTLVIAQADPEAPLRSHQDFGDSIVEFDIKLDEGRAGVYLQGRYEVVLAPAGADEEPDLDTMGALSPRRDENRDPAEFDGVPPKKSAAKPSGEWQTVRIRFRAPRYNEAGEKTEPALLLEVRVNGEQVQRNTIATGFTPGAVNAWETPEGPLMIRAREGTVAIRKLSLAHADFGTVSLPEESGGETNEEELADFVALGEKTFQDQGCTSCHVVKEGDTSARSGPSLYGLFQRSARDRRVQEGDSDTRFTLKANRSYLHSSVRTPDAELAISERGSSEGEVYQPIMPAYGEDALTDSELDAIGAYLKTLNPLEDQGPVVQLVEEGGPETYDPLTDGLQRLVLDEVVVQRGPMEGASGRAVHVGLPNGVNYSFDPRVLGVVKLWQGGFLDMSGELRNRGGGGLAMGHSSREIDIEDSSVLFAPLSAEGRLVDFSFKEPLFEDVETMEEALYAERDHQQMLDAVDARFRGYSVDSRRKQTPPAFAMTVGDNPLEWRLSISEDGELEVTVDGSLEDDQSFAISNALIDQPRVSAGEVSDGRWRLSAGTDLPVTLKGHITISQDPWRPPQKSVDYERQPLKVTGSDAALLDGYAIEDYLPPKDNYGRDLLFEALGIDVAPDGTVVVATRNAGIWRIVDGEWRLFAEGLFDSLGVVIEDKSGTDLVVGQKAELTRIRDTNGDGMADEYRTLYDGFGYHSNYHTYMHGPVKGKDGAYYFGLNLAHTDEAVYKADGLYMGSQGGYSGWAFRVTPEGEAERWASGLRSAAGWALGPDDDIWITENQGEFVGTSKLFVLEEDAFYGHPSSLVDLPGMTPDSPEIAWEKVKDEREQERLLMPQNLLANSPGHPVWDLTEGRFGPFEGQMLIGDQTQSNLFRVSLETLPDGTVQGAALPFAAELSSGAMRPVFLEDGSLLLGQTGRGWQAKGGHVASLQRLVWKGEQAPFAIERMTVTQTGFVLEFTRPVPAEVDEESLREALSLSSWTYRDAPDYGSERLGEREEAVTSVTLDDARRQMELSLETTEIPEVHPDQTARVYHLVLESDLLARDHGGVPLSAFYTLHRFHP